MGQTVADTHGAGRNSSRGTGSAELQLPSLWVGIGCLYDLTVDLGTNDWMKPLGQMRVNKDLTAIELHTGQGAPKVLVLVLYPSETPSLTHL